MPNDRERELQSEVITLKRALSMLQQENQYYKECDRLIKEQLKNFKENAISKEEVYKALIEIHERTIQTKDEEINNLQDDLQAANQTINNLEQAHGEFLDTQLHFYQQAKPDTFALFEATNPPNSNLTIGDFLNFLEAQWQNKQQQINQVKQHLTNWINLITNKNNHN